MRGSAGSTNVFPIARECDAVRHGSAVIRGAPASSPPSAGVTWGSQIQGTSCLPHPLQEFFPRGTLEVMLHHTAAKRWDTAKLLLIIRSIASGVQYLHTRSPPILHRDIKPGNLFVGVNQARITFSSCFIHFVAGAKLRSWLQSLLDVAGMRPPLTRRQQHHPRHV